MRASILLRSLDKKILQAACFFSLSYSMSKSENNDL